MGPTKRGKGTKIMAISDKSSLPIALHVDSASPSEIKLVEKTLDACATGASPQLLIGDKAYDSDPLDDRLRKAYHIELVAPHRRNRVKPKTQDGRTLRRYRRRWTVERLFAWLQNYRRVIIRYEYKLANYRAFVQLAAILILLRSI